MDEEFESFVVTNPDLVDEGIDVSGLRTQTDTSPFLLGNIPDYSGIQYDYLGPTKYSDLMRLYSQGLPMFDTPQAAEPVTTAPDTGDGGQATLPIDTIQPIDTPITTDLTGDQINEFAMPNNIGGITGDPITVENIGLGTEYTQPDGTVINIDPLEEQMLLEELYNEEFGTDTFTPTLQPNTMDGAPVIGDFDNPTTGTISDDRLNEVIGGQPMAAGPFDYLQQTPISQVQVPGVTQADLTQAQIDEERIAGYITQEDIQDDKNVLQKLGLPEDLILKKQVLNLV